MNNYAQSVDNSQMSIGFQASRSFSTVNKMFTTENLMCTTRYANLWSLFYKHYPQAIITYTSIFFEKIKKQKYNYEFVNTGDETLLQIWRTKFAKN